MKRRETTPLWICIATLAVISCKLVPAKHQDQRSPAKQPSGNATSTSHYVPTRDPALPRTLGTKANALIDSVTSPICPNATVAAPDVSARMADIAKASGLSHAYFNACANCHGYYGEGRDGFPKIQGTVSQDAFKAIVRSGKNLMPNLPVMLYPDDVLASDYQALQNLAGKNLPDTSGFKDVPSSDLAPIEAADYQAAIFQGLKAWRDPGDKGSCAQCHGPDAVDLARIGYSASNILRRAIKQGRSTDESLSIVAMIDAQRRWLGIKDPCSPSLFRPLQPAGRPLSGTDGQSLDAALMAAMKSAPVKLDDAPSTYEQARAMADQVLKINPQALPIGISLSRWSDDAIDGAPFKSTAKWIPELAMEPTDSTTDAAWTSLENSYLEDPSDTNFWALYDGVSPLDASRFGSGGGVAERLSRERYRSVLLMQHMMRRNSLALPDLHATATYMKFSVWETAQVATVMIQGCGETDLTATLFPCWNYPAAFFDKLGRDRAYLLADTQAIVAPWLIAGLLIDPGLQFTENGDAQILHLHQAMIAAEPTAPDTQGNHVTLPLHQIYFGLLRLVKGVEGGDESLPGGHGFERSTVNGCWNTLHPGIKQWQGSTLPILTRMGVAGQALIAADAVNMMILQLADAAARNPKAACKEYESREAFLQAINAIATWGQGESPYANQKQTLATDISHNLK